MRFRDPIFTEKSCFDYLSNSFLNLGMSGEEFEDDIFDRKRSSVKKPRKTTLPAFLLTRVPNYDWIIEQQHPRYFITRNVFKSKFEDLGDTDVHIF